MESRDGSADLETSLAQARIQIDDVEGAKSGFSAALSAKPGYPRALVGKARLDAASGDVAAATTEIEDALANDPSLVDAWLLKGDIAAVQNHPDDALAAYRKAIEIKPDFLTGHVMIASILLREEKLEDVEKQLEAMKKIAPKHPQTLYLSALLAFRDQQFQLARDTVQQFLKLAPDNGAGLLLSARISFELGALNQAEAELKNVLYRYPKDEVARRLLIQTYLRTNQPAKALEATQPLLHEGSLDASSLSLIGEVYARNDDFSKAVPLFEKAAALDPKNSAKRTTLGLAYLAKGDVSRGLEQLEGAAATDTGVRADLALIVSNVRQRKFDAALAGIAALQKKQPESPLPYHLRGGVLLVKGDV